MCIDGPRPQRQDARDLGLAAPVRQGSEYFVLSAGKAQRVERFRLKARILLLEEKHQLRFAGQEPDD
jgi:hypothetical protein